MALEIDRLSVRFGDREALHDVSFSVETGSTVSLLGPSGSGKTTLLRVIAGLEAPTAGAVRLDGRDLAGVPIHQRGVGLMFQDFALFPHRDVAGNVGFGLRMAHEPEPRIRARVTEVLELVGLPGIERRAISTLSGGEQQRVALARALAPRPRVLLLDEPMGSLDRALRERLPLELRALFEGLDFTVLYVTHDQDEALAVADRTLVLHDGSLEADAPSERLWADPPNAFVARFLGYRNVVSATRTADGLDTPWGILLAPTPELSRLAPGTRLTLLARPEGLSIEPAAAGPAEAPRLGRPTELVLAGTVSTRRFRGDHFTLEVDVNGALLEVELHRPPMPAAGAAVRIRVDPDSLLMLPAEPAILDG